MDIDLDKLGRLAGSHYLAGVVGSAVSLRFMAGASRLDKLLAFAAGTACAVYVSPLLAHLLHLHELGPSAGLALAFATGLFGLSLAGAILRAIGDMPLATIISGWISRGKSTGE